MVSEDIDVHLQVCGVERGRRRVGKAGGGGEERGGSHLVATVETLVKRTERQP